MSYSICSKCGKKFKDINSVDDRLVRAIFGDHPECKECREITGECTMCFKPTTSNDSITLNDELIHLRCVPYEEIDEKYLE